MGCRTNTADLTTLTLPGPNEVTFVFDSSTSPTNVIRITIPSSSKWRMPFHWHPSQTSAEPTNTVACQSVACVSGDIHAYVASDFRRSYDSFGHFRMIQFKPGQRLFWERYEGRIPCPLVVDLVGDRDLWQNICSATLDKDIYPRLGSTPLWLKCLLAVLTWVPSWRERLLAWLLWTQIQTIFYAHDVHVNHGWVRFTLPWTAQPFGGTPPAWAGRWQFRSQDIIARIVMGSAHWLGTLFLGMRGHYAEYTPSSRPTGVLMPHDDESDKVA